MQLQRTKIVCTIGPASESPERIAQLIAAGMNVARLNMSHGSHAEQANRAKLVREAAAKQGKLVAILVDIRGPKMRVGRMRGGLVNLSENAFITLTEKNIEGDGKTIPIDQADFLKKIRAGNRIYLDDGALELEVVSVGKKGAKCRILIGGKLKDRKGITVPGVSFDLKSITAKDVVDLKFAATIKPDYVAQSFVKNADNVREFRKRLDKNGCDASIIAKIEEPLGLRNIDEIIAVADGIMVARGDLGVQMPFEDVPLAQKQIVLKCHRANKPVIIATQMLESMINSPQPTRAEVADVANAILDGADAVMLSAETAAGNYPIRAVETISRIALKTESSLMVYDRVEKTRERLEPIEAIGKSVVYTARDLQASAIITYTSSGHTARYISSYRPSTPIIATTANERELRRLVLLWGVTPELVEKPLTTDDLFKKSVNAALRHGRVKKGDVVVITAGIPLNQPGNTNMLKIHKL